MQEQENQQPALDMQALNELLTQAAQRGAERALAQLGLENGSAARDIRDLRSLIDAWRSQAGRTVMGLVQAVTTGTGNGFLEAAARTGGT
ncbi:MAG: hypothetical protein EB072_07175 [Betaproteobacteria bacterium]|nr:hypothetical protein [Betaproteobacteria bacterium]